MSKTRVLLIGWRTEAVTALQRLGADVTCVHTAGEDHKRAGLLDDDHSIVVEEPSSIESTLAGLHRHGAAVPEFDVVCTQGEFTLVNTSVLGGERSLTAVGDAVALRDKHIQKERVRSAGIPVADSRFITHAREIVDFPHDHGVLKPLSASGTVGVTAWHDTEERLRLATELDETGRSGPWLAEQWVDGAELHLDGVVRSGELLFLSVGKYLHNVLSIRDGEFVATVMRHPTRHRDMYARARDIANHSLETLGHRDGVFHMEVFEQGDHLVFGECGGRIAGGSFDEMIRLQHGVDINDEWARAVLGMEPACTANTSDSCFGDVFLTTPAGTLESCPTEAEVAKRDGVRFVSLRARTGDSRAEAATASSSYAGSAVIDGANEQHTADRLQRLADWFFRESTTSSS